MTALADLLHAAMLRRAGVVAPAVAVPAPAEATAIQADRDGDRQACPTCGGTRWVGGDDGYASGGWPCPDCEAS